MTHFLSRPESSECPQKTVMTVHQRHIRRRRNPIESSVIRRALGGSRSTWLALGPWCAAWNVRPSPALTMLAFALIHTTPALLPGRRHRRYRQVRRLNCSRSLRLTCGIPGTMLQQLPGSQAREHGRRLLHRHCRSRGRLGFVLTVSLGCHAADDDKQPQDDSEGRGRTVQDASKHAGRVDHGPETPSGPYGGVARSETQEHGREHAPQDLEYCCVSSGTRQKPGASSRRRIVQTSSRCPPVVTRARGTAVPPDMVSICH